jgi:UDP-glucose 4-epimerase
MKPDLHGARIFITGGAGFIGSTIADQVLEAGAERVVVLDDLVRGRQENLAQAKKTGRVEVTVGDICDAPLVDRLTEGCDLVFHQAALRITHCAAEPVRAVRVMVNGTQNVLESAVKHKVRRVLAASSASVYGEASYLPMDEKHPFNNRTLYGAAKIGNEQMFRSYADMFGLQYLMLRPFNVYGPRMDVFGAYTEVMIRWLERLAKGQAPVIFGDGKQTMDFIHVADVARAYLLAAVSERTDEVYNAGFGKETSLKELCAALCAAAGKPGMQPEYAAERKVNPVARRQAETSLAKAAIGFTAEIPLEAGLLELVRWQAEVTKSA